MYQAKCGFSFHTPNNRKRRGLRRLIPQRPSQRVAMTVASFANVSDHRWSSDVVGGSTSGAGGFSFLTCTGASPSLCQLGIQYVVPCFLGNWRNWGTSS